MNASQASITDTESVVVDASADARNAVLRIPSGLSDVCYVGPSGIDDTTGFEIPADGTPIAVFVPYGESLYAVCATATTTTLHVYQA